MPLVSSFFNCMYFQTLRFFFNLPVRYLRLPFLFASFFSSFDH
ncbi:hypothetical protein NC651_040182 [Populus alba x Populus x berolinensis]|nr:hypothetical protein NC651_040182 [Populus alba x Populus x berolinensis]